MSQVKTEGNMSLESIRMSSVIEKTGRIVFPALIRKALGLDLGDKINIELVDDKVIITAGDKEKPAEQEVKT